MKESLLLFSNELHRQTLFTLFLHEAKHIAHSQKNSGQNIPFTNVNMW